MDSCGVRIYPDCEYIQTWIEDEEAPWIPPHESELRSRVEDPHPSLLSHSSVLEGPRHSPCVNTGAFGDHLDSDAVGADLSPEAPEYVSHAVH